MTSAPLRSLVLAVGALFPFGLVAPDARHALAPRAAADTVPDPGVAEIVARVDAASYEQYLRGLGVDEGDRRGYDDDGTPQADLVAARAFIAGALTASLGADNVTLQDFSAWGYDGVNVVGVLPGTGERADERYVIAAHSDSEQNPGADDDASGVAGVLEAARVLAGSRFDATLLFVALDQEEERDNGWSRGSRAFVRRARHRSGIKAMVSLDMIAHRNATPGRAAIARCDFSRRSRSAKLYGRIAAAFAVHSSLGVAELRGEDSSDPIRFFRAGIPSVLLSEECDADGWPINPYYHELSDFHRNRSGAPQQIEGADYIDTGYASEIVKGVVAWAATEAGLQQP